ncbi:DUF3631 domain-containing protein [Mycobacterium vicinigordonae]|nr:DUF3631 domain-containing protein [Mycobacterium vicinigordonae]
MTDISDRPSDQAGATSNNCDPTSRTSIHNTPDRYSVVEQIQVDVKKGNAAMAEKRAAGDPSASAEPEADQDAAGDSKVDASSAGEPPPVGSDAPTDLVDGARLLDELLAILTRYVVFPDAEAAVAVALWVAATHAIEAWHAAPRLILNSPQKRCGKTRALDVISGLCHAALITANARAAAIYRSIDAKRPPTLVIDEVDAIFGTKRAAEQNEDLRALINAGYQRNRPALRCVGPRHEPTEFATFAMAALAGIGAMPDTITDRAVNITMRRRSANEKVSQFRCRRDEPMLHEMRDRLAEWTLAHIEELAAAEPELPVDDRAAEE